MHSLKCSALFAVALFFNSAFAKSADITFTDVNITVIEEASAKVAISDPESGNSNSTTIAPLASSTEANVSTIASVSPSAPTAPPTSSPSPSTGAPVVNSNPFIIASQPTRPPPKPEVNPINTKLLLYTRRNPIVGHQLIAGDPESIASATNYKVDQPIRFIVHGSFDGLDFGHWMRDMKSKFLDIEDPNVIVVDWSPSAAISNTVQRLANARIVGHQMARVIEDFIAHYQTQPEDIHIIAHGDGTFAADVVGQRIRGIGRISGLNPSGPNFDLLPPELRLDKTDANFVDIIHTDAQNASLSLYRRGTSMSLGHVDFYPNGGLSQPGCNLDDFDDLLKKAVSEGLRTFLSCSHYRAIDYYIESIKEQTQCLHMGYECANYQDFLRGACGHCNDDTHLCAEMGFRSNLYFNQLKREKSSPITMYFNTNKKKPYCLYHYNIQINVAQEPAQVRGGLLKVRVDGEKDSMDVRIYGGTGSFKAGYTTGIIATHPNDIGPVKGVSVNWLPNSYMTLLYGENLFVEDVRVAPIAWDETKLKTDEITTLCPSTRTGLVTPFYGETYFHKSSNCTYQFTKVF